jgi:hypothetical protein
VRALSLTQPWATLIAIGAKSIETRSWRAAYDGVLAIHAARKWTPTDRVFALGAAAPVLHAAGWDPRGGLPTGEIVALVTVRDIVRVELIRDTLSPQERIFGNYSDGRWAWLLELPRPLRKPVPMRGSLGLWLIDAATSEHLERLAA